MRPWRQGEISGASMPLRRIRVPSWQRRVSPSVTLITAHRMRASSMGEGGDGAGQGVSFRFPKIITDRAPHAKQALITPA